MATVVLSLNELTSLSRQALEALMGHDWDYDAAARQVVWLQARGLDGVQRMLASAAALQSAVSGISFFQPVSDDGDWHTVNFDGDSWFRLGDLVIDQAIAGARQGDPIRIQVNQVRDRLGVLPGLDRCARAGLAASARWIEGSGVGRRCRIGAGDAEPELVTLQNSNDTRDRTSAIRLCCGDDSQFGADHSAALDAPGCLRDRISNDEFQRRYVASLDDGIPLFASLYRQIDDIARRVLIEASEASRQGAGA